MTIRQQQPLQGFPFGLSRWTPPPPKKKKEKKKKEKKKRNPWIVWVEFYFNEVERDWTEDITRFCRISKHKMLVCDEQNKQHE